MLNNSTAQVSQVWRTSRLFTAPTTIFAARKTGLFDVFVRIGYEVWRYKRSSSLKYNYRRAYAEQFNRTSVTGMENKQALHSSDYFFLRRPQNRPV
jgi:hypothetical protein